jgi:hypothetical protein
VIIKGQNVLVLGGYGLVGTAVCRQLLHREPEEIIIHSLRPEEAEEARRELLPEAGSTRLSVASGDILGLEGDHSRFEQIAAQIAALDDDKLPEYRLYNLLAADKPSIVIDCVNTATAIAYRNVYHASQLVLDDLEQDRIDPEHAAQLLESQYIPRLIRHMQVLYRGMQAAETKIYIKVGTSGTGGMGLNVPYTHSEEKPSRVLMSKSAVGGAHSLMLFLLARTPGAPITKEIKPAAAIAWKKIAYGPIYRHQEPIRLMEAEPRSLGSTFSTFDETAARITDDILTTVYIDTGENGIFSLEEFAMLTTAAQMEFVTPEEIAKYLIFEIEGGNTGHDVINALDNAVLGPSYRAGMMRHWAMEWMTELEATGKTRSVGFEMLGPPRNTKLLFEAHLLREAFCTMTAVRDSTAEEVARKLDAIIRDQSRLASEVISVGIPILLDSGEILRGQRVIVPSEASQVEVTPEKLENWVRNGWVDLRTTNCQRWIDRFRKIHDEILSKSATDTSSRHLRNHRFWADDKGIQPGKLVGWILSEEEHGDRFKH